MDKDQATRLTSRELYSLFERLFPHGFGGADVLAEIAPQGWEHSPLLACFHPSVEQLFEERVPLHRNLEEWRRLGRRREGTAALEPRSEPTLDDVRREYEPSPVKQEEEVTELVGLCLWDIFSDNHDVIAPDGRIADIGSFRAAGAFLDEYLTRDQEGWKDGDYMRFYMGTIWISQRADLTPVYAMIFRRLKSLGADWVSNFPEIGIVELAPVDDRTDNAEEGYSVSQAAVAELEAQKRRAEVERFRAELREANARARGEAMDRPPPATVRAYRQVYGRIHAAGLQCERPVPRTKGFTGRRQCPRGRKSRGQAHGARAVNGQGRCEEMPAQKAQKRGAEIRKKLSPEQREELLGILKARFRKT